MCRSSRWPINTCSPSRWRACTPACRSCATRTTSSISARRWAACAWAATSATRRRGASTGSRPTSTASCSRRTCRGSSRSWKGAIRRVPVDGGRPGQPGHQRSRGVHAGQRVHPGRVRGPRLLGRGRLLRARHRRRRWDRPPDGDLDRRTASRSWTSGRWTSGGSGRPIGRRATRWRAPSRTTRRTTTSTTRTRSASPVGRSGPAPRTSSWPDLGASFGEKSGWERPNWFESNAAAGDEALRPRGWAGEHWSPAIGAEALATRTDGRACSTRARSPSSR